MEAPPPAEMGAPCRPRSCSPPGETVCAALARYENSFRDAIREIRVDVGAFQLGVERRLEAAAAGGPLGRAVAQLQQENRQLRGQLEALALQVELLSGLACDRSALLISSSSSSHAGQNHKNHLSDIQEIREVIYANGEAGGALGGHAAPSPPPGSGSPPAGSRVSSVATGPAASGSPSAARFSSRATFAVSSKTNLESRLMRLYMTQRHPDVMFSNVPEQEEGPSQ
ncbi:Smoothelin-like protein 2 [Liparis tanakae]|uniref:Smoothelin-like protein 2 n=1 Tax=Liparis tanakae TaxID=230148 RepID=A0A4Z2EHC1_9TELE|nr:Smoothelin-like protein 2 [Liparis tanakae]